MGGEGYAGPLLNLFKACLHGSHGLRDTQRGYVGDGIHADTPSFSKMPDGIKTLVKS
jgi:hypothetical protein